MAGQGLHPAEHRNGPAGYAKLWLKKSQTRFVALAAAEHYVEAV
jgi:replicative DNA helicase